MRIKVYLIFVIILMFPVCVYGKLSFRFDLGGGWEDEGRVAIGGSEEIIIGVHTDETLSYSSDVLLGNVQSSGWYIYDSQALQPGVIKYDINDGFESYLIATSTDPGMMFSMKCRSEMSRNPYENLFLLWSRWNAFDVPVDSLYVWAGGAPGVDITMWANAGGKYTLGPGGSVTFDATESERHYMPWEDPDNGRIEKVEADDLLAPFWSLNGVDIAYGVKPTISYDLLVGELDLAPGEYDLTLEFRGGLFFMGEYSDTATLQIIPEPATLGLFGLGMGILVRRKRRIQI